MHEPVRLRIPVPFTVGTVNAYLLRGSPLTLVDPGPLWQPAIDALEVGLASERLRVEDIELVLVSHQHSDHIGLADTVAERAGCPIAAHEFLASALAPGSAATAAEAEYESALMALHGTPDSVVRTVSTVLDAASQYGASAAITQVLADGSRLAVAGRELEVSLRPGHSPTDTIFIADDRMALVADHLALRHPVIVLAHRPPRASTDPRHRPRAMLVYRESLRATLRSGLTTAYPGHGPLVDDPAAVIRQELRGQEQRATQAIERLRSGAMTAWDLACASGTAGALRDGIHPVPPAFIALSNVLAQLDLLVDGGRVRELDDGANIRFELTGR